MFRSIDRLNSSGQWLKTLFSPLEVYASGSTPHPRHAVFLSTGLALLSHFFSRFGRAVPSPSGAWVALSHETIWVFLLCLGFSADCDPLVSLQQGSSPICPFLLHTRGVGMPVPPHILVLAPLFPPDDITAMFAFLHFFFPALGEGAVSPAFTRV